MGNKADTRPSIASQGCGTFLEAIATYATSLHGSLPTTPAVGPALLASLPQPPGNPSSIDYPKRSVAGPPSRCDWDRRDELRVVER